MESSLAIPASVITGYRTKSRRIRAAADIGRFSGRTSFETHAIEDTRTLVVFLVTLSAC